MTMQVGNMATCKPKPTHIAASFHPEVYSRRPVVGYKKMWVLHFDGNNLNNSASYALGDLMHTSEQYKPEQ